MAHLFPPLEIHGIPVKGENGTYPVNRIFCVGRNYDKHAAEMGIPVDREKPFYFTKSPSAATPTGATTPYPSGTTNFHFEIELCVAMGGEVFKGQGVDGSIYGYCVGLDMTRRDLQLGERAHQRPWSLGKDVENSAVFAPITKAADFGAISDQHIWLTQNGDMKQDATLAELVWKVDEILAHLSGFYRLQPGDIIMTGTPAGVGPVDPGDVIEGGIDGLDPIALTIGPAE